MPGIVVVALGEPGRPVTCCVVWCACPAVQPAKTAKARVGITNLVVCILISMYLSGCLGVRLGLRIHAR